MLLWTIVGWMHAAVIIFIIGLDIYLYTVHTAPAYATTAITGGGAVIYVCSSLIPLFDASCPYRTPLTDFVATTLLVCLSVLSCLLSFIVIPLAAPLTAELRRAISPSMVFPFMLDPLITGQVWRALVNFINRIRSGEPVALLPHLLRAIRDPEIHEKGEKENEFAISGVELDLLWERVGPCSLRHPSALYYLVLELLDVEDGDDYGELFVGFRQDKQIMARVAANLTHVDSVYAATGAIRLLQMLFQSQTQ